jgi:hypothetical protein
LVAWHDDDDWLGPEEQQKTRLGFLCEKGLYQYSFTVSGRRDTHNSLGTSRCRVVLRECREKNNYNDDTTTKRKNTHYCERQHYLN